MPLKYNTEVLSYSVENIANKQETAIYQHYLPFLAMFLQLPSSWSFILGIVWQWVKASFMF